MTQDDKLIEDIARVLKSYETTLTKLDPATPPWEQVKSLTDILKAALQKAREIRHQS